MSAKNLDQRGRLRNKIVALRMSPEENEMLNAAVAISGLTKQDGHGSAEPESFQGSQGQTR